MKFHLLMFSVFITVGASMISCKSNSRDKGEAKTQYAGSNKKDADDIIKFNNALVKLNDNHDEYLKDVGKAVNDIDAWFKDPGPFSTFIGTTPFERPYFKRYDDADPQNPPSALSSADREFFKTNVALLNSKFKQIKDTYKQLSDYVKAQDYKDDKYAKGNSLIVSLDSLGKDYYTTEDKVMLKLNLIADDAERIILQDHPLKDYIYAMKDDSKAASQINSLLDSAADNYKAIEPLVQKQYNSLDSQSKKHTALSVPDKPNYTGQKSNYTSFNNTVGDYLIELRRIMRDASAAGKITDSDLSTLSSKRESMRTYYNNFVD